MSADVQQERKQDVAASSWSQCSKLTAAGIARPRRSQSHRMPDSSVSLSLSITTSRCILIAYILQRRDGRHSLGGVVAVVAVVAVKVVVVAAAAGRRVVVLYCRRSLNGGESEKRISQERHVIGDSQRMDLVGSEAQLYAACTVEKLTSHSAR